MNGGVAICVDVDPSRIERRLQHRYLDVQASDLEDALRRAEHARDSGQALSIGLLGNCADVFPEMLERDAPIAPAPPPRRGARARRAPARSADASEPRRSSAPGRASGRRPREPPAPPCPPCGWRAADRARPPPGARTSRVPTAGCPRAPGRARRCASRRRPANRWRARAGTVEPARAVLPLAVQHLEVRHVVRRLLGPGRLGKATLDVLVTADGVVVSSARERARAA